MLKVLNNAGNFKAIHRMPISITGSFILIRPALPSSTVGCKLLIQKKKKLPLQMAHLNEIKHLQRLVSNSGALWVSQL